MTNRMKWLALGVLVLTWIGLLYLLVIDAPPPEEVPLKYQSGQAVTKNVAAAPAETWEVHSLQAQARQLPDTPKRNLFTPLSRPVDPQATLAAQRKQEAQTRAAATAVAKAAPPAPPVPPPPTPEELAQQQEALRRKQLQEQMTQYRYLGYVNQNGVQKAFLGKGREIYIMREGDTLDGKFQVALIEATSVTLLNAESKLETILKLKKEESPAGT